MRKNRSRHVSLDNPFCVNRTVCRLEAGATFFLATAEAAEEEGNGILCALRAAAVKSAWENPSQSFDDKEFGKALSVVYHFSCSSLASLRAHSRGVGHKHPAAQDRFTRQY